MQELEGRADPPVVGYLKMIYAGTMAGGWRIVKTLGREMVKLQPMHSFAEIFF